MTALNEARYFASLKRLHAKRSGDYSERRDDAIRAASAEGTPQRELARDHWTLTGSDTAYLRPIREGQVMTDTLERLGWYLRTPHGEVGPFTFNEACANFRKLGAGACYRREIRDECPIYFASGRDDR